ncbi:MAG: aminoacyl-tRNA hydrolase [Spartobacteria bacterium]|nr:aminoacyl-tRNA hydrolase [Spartobacteria bacterium]
MKMVAGLGNPGRRYAATRHNIGFMVVDEVARNQDGAFRKHWFIQASSCPCTLAGEKVLLAKPRTFMNLSGLAVKALMCRYRMTPEDIVVIFDDLDLPVGQLRIRSRGSAGGHKGLQSVIEALDTQAFIRLRIGIGRCPEGKNVIDYVLSDFTAEERTLMMRATARAVCALEEIFRDGVDKAMNTFNGIS